MSFRIVIFSLLVEHVIVEAMGAILDRGSLSLPPLQPSPPFALI